MWGQIISGLFGPVVDYFTTKQEKKAQAKKQELEYKKAVHEARLENIRQGKINEAQWNLESIRNAGWKDEWLTIILSIPLILVFIPSMVQYITDGFEALKQTPEWYRYGVMLMISSAFGYQKFVNYKSRKKYE